MHSLVRHLEQCDTLDHDAAAAAENSNDFGVNSRSVLLELKHFDLCGGTLIPDVTHDMLEGALQHIMKLILHYCTKEKKYFSIAQLNQTIDGMKLGYMEDNRPATLVHNDKILEQNGEIYA